jgi:oligopeptide/dipeptide ABC transporter ATP-binding protein
MVLITHEIDIARKLADQAAVMYLGRMVETGPGGSVLEHPNHPYSRMLLASLPVANPHVRTRPAGRGEAASAMAPPPGCAYHPRCPYVQDGCTDSVPLLRVHDDRMLACHRAEEVCTRTAIGDEPPPSLSALTAAVEGCPVEH